MTNRCVHPGRSCLAGKDSKYGSLIAKRLRLALKFPASADTRSVPGKLLAGIVKAVVRKEGQEETSMSIETILIILLVVFLLGGGGWYYGRR
jgi:hypothetical protein